jgi:hypothetical protein
MGLVGRSKRFAIQFIEFNAFCRCCFRISMPFLDCSYFRPFRIAPTLSESSNSLVQAIARLSNGEVERIN